MPLVDMSAQAVTARLREASTLRRFTLELERAGRAAGIETGVVQLRPGAKADLKAFAKGSPPSHLICVDLGFSNGAASCGLAVDDSRAEALEFQACVDAVKSELKSWAAEPKPTALVIEAPLSMQFDERRNPQGRPFESGKPPPYWYLRAGAAMCLAAQIFLARLREVRLARDLEVVLFEGYVASKEKKTKHADDADLLRRCLRGEAQHRPHEVENGQSLLELLGLTPGAPLVIEPLQAKPGSPGGGA